MATAHRIDLDCMRSYLADLPDQVGPGFRAGSSLAESALNSQNVAPINLKVIAGRSRSTRAREAESIGRMGRTEGSRGGERRRPRAHRGR
ncbi:MAG TPA: hypothetical protein VMV28_03140 [Thermoplasmata archaeon]|nr:hypothetical protein [Thermoplasmata archaeon]